MASSLSAAQQRPKKRIAIVGSGISGLATLYSLRNSGHDVHLYEQAHRLGGHTNTVEWEHEGNKCKVDTGFIVLNSFTYPNFIAFLKELSIPAVPTEMSFSVSRNGGAFEWSGTNLFTLFAQRSNLYSFTFYRMVLDILRFNLSALDFLASSASDLDLVHISIGAYLKQNNYSREFREDYLLPMTACVWSTGADKCALDFPAVTLIRFMWNHHLLTVGKRPTWMTIPGGSRKYIDAVISSLAPSREHLGTKVVRVSSSREHADKVLLHTADGKREVFDRVVLACHGDECRELVEGGEDADLEREILSSFETTENKAYLHNDISLMPKRRKAWAAWNYLTTTSSPQHSKTSEQHLVSLTYSMNILQHIDPHTFSNVLVSLNPPHLPAASSLRSVFTYTHPLYTPASIRAQSLLPQIQGRNGIYYCGAWTGYGFHEDGFSSGLAVGLTQDLGGSVPFNVLDARKLRGDRPRIGIRHRVAMLVLLWLAFCMDVALTLKYLVGKAVVRRQSRGWWTASPPPRLTNGSSSSSAASSRPRAGNGASSAAAKKRRGRNAPLSSGSTL